MTIPAPKTLSFFLKMIIALVVSAVAAGLLFYLGQSFLSLSPQAVLVIMLLMYVGGMSLGMKVFSSKFFIQVIIGIVLSTLYPFSQVVMIVLLYLFLLRVFKIVEMQEKIGGT